MSENRLNVLALDPDAGAMQGLRLPIPVIDVVVSTQNPASPTHLWDGAIAASSRTVIPKSHALPLKSRPCILVVDDDPLNFDLLEDTFEDSCDMLSASNGKMALDIVSGKIPDVILLDVMMPGISGYEVCRLLKAQHRTRDIPIIFITGTNNIAGETKGLDLGAVDYVTKPINPASVKARVKNQLKLKSAQDQLARLATTDALTGLANRGHFDNMLAYEYARHARSRTEFSLILLDIDHFKNFNDLFGHLCGDECLRLVARAIRAVVVRATDLAARFGGEEFVILLPETKIEAAVLIAEKIGVCIHEISVPHDHSVVMDRITASFGVSGGRPLPRGSASTMLSHADEQLYMAKSAGRNRVSAIRCT